MLLVVVPAVPRLPFLAETCQTSHSAALTVHPCRFWHCRERVAGHLTCWPQPCAMCVSITASAAVDSCGTHSLIGCCVARSSVSISASVHQYGTLPPCTMHRACSIPSIWQCRWNTVYTIGAHVAQRRLHTKCTVKRIGGPQGSGPAGQGLTRRSNCALFGHWLD
jgi:hypothetical protein